MDYSYQDQGERRACLGGVRRIVVKVGTQLLRKPDPRRRVEELVESVAGLRGRGYEVIVVSSGAVGIGMSTMGTGKRPKSIARLQAYAAVGQCHLMRFYETACERAGFHCGQMLLTAADLHAQDRNLKVAQCLEALLAEGILPVINENDSVCVDEIKVGDNDTLAAYLATMLRADLTILMTTVDGLHETRPGSDELGRRISVVRSLDGVMRMARDTDGNAYSTGGMTTKLHAAQIVTLCGSAMLILDGGSFSELAEALSGKDTGTLFTPGGSRKLHNRQRFLAFFSEPAGDLIVDAGAKEALCRQDRSLLPGGILGSRGLFHRGDIVRILDAERNELARGVVNFAYDEIARICGARSAEVAGILQMKDAPQEAVHKDNLVLTPA